MLGPLTLRDFKGSVIAVGCKPRGQQGALDQKALVKQFGASMRFVDLRRRKAMGCNRMYSPDGRDRCGTQFPCLLEAAVVFELQKPRDRWSFQSLIAFRKGRKRRLDPHWIGGRQCVTFIT